MELYRSGHNEAVLKTVCPKGTWVRIPPAPPPETLEITAFQGFSLAKIAVRIFADFGKFHARRDFFLQEKTRL